MTFGQVGTDPTAHSITVIPGEARFTFEARSHSADLLAEIESELRKAAERVAGERRVSFAFDPAAIYSPMATDGDLTKRLFSVAADLGIPATRHIGAALRRSAPGPGRRYR